MHFLKILISRSVFNSIGILIRVVKILTVTDITYILKLDLLFTNVSECADELPDLCKTINCKDYGTNLMKANCKKTCGHCKVSIITTTLDPRAAKTAAIKAKLSHQTTKVDVHFLLTSLDSFPSETKVF